MSTLERPSELSNANVGDLKIQFDEYDIAEVLEFEGTFTARDFDRDRYQTKGVLRILRNSGAIKVVDEVRVNDVNGNGRSWINEYEWHDSAIEYLESYQENRPELPCGCRAHIYHNDDGTLGCRYCEDDPVFDREVVKEAMSQ